MALASVAITQFWNAKVYSWQTTPPTVPTGTEIAFAARLTNTSGKALDMSLYMVIYNPDGSICHDFTYSYAGSPGFYTGRIPWFVDANISSVGKQAGVYKASAYAYVSGVLVASATGVTMATLTGILSAKINDWDWWDPSTNAWTPTVPSSVIVGQQIGIQPHAVNQGGVALNVHLDLLIYDPDGIQTTIHGSQVTLQDGGTQNPAAWTHWDIVWQATKVGDYIVDMTLYGDQGILDKITGIPVAYAKETGPTSSGHAIPLNIHDVTTNADYNNPSLWPIEIDHLNDSVWGSVKFFNDSTVPITVNLRIWFEDPSSSQKVLYTETATIPVGGSKTITTSNVTLNKVGYWYLCASMDLGGPIPKSYIWNALAVQAPLPEFAQLNISITDLDQEPITGVAVVLGAYYTSTTGTDGTCALINIPVGTYTIKCTKTGYQTYTQSVTLGQGNNALVITMVATSVTPAQTWWEKYWWVVPVGGGALVLIAALSGKEKKK